MRIENDAVSWIALDGAVNARVVVPGVLLRADNMQSLSAEDVRVLIDQEGLAVVIDLRTNVEVTLEGPGPLTAEAAVRIEHRSLYPDPEVTPISMPTRSSRGGRPTRTSRPTSPPPCART